MKRRRAGGWAALGLIGLLAAAACDSRPAEATRPVSEPVLADDAEPLVVLESFLKMVVIRDCARSRALSTDDGFRQVGGLCDRINVVDFRIDGDPARPSAREVVFAATLTMDGTEGGPLAGPTTMFFTLERQSNGAWRIAGGGSGP